MWKTAKRICLVFLRVLALIVFTTYQWWPRGPRPGTVLDEAKLANRGPESFPAAGENYFQDMDADAKGPVKFNEAQIKGRNTWIVWTGGDDGLWDTLGVKSLGALDFLKLLSSYKPNPTAKRPSNRAEVALQRLRRSNRWSYLGLVNEPCFEEATGPDPNRFGLWLDRRKPVSADCPADPFEDEGKYPGVKIGRRGQTLPEGIAGCLPPDKRMPVASFYGSAQGSV